MVEGGKTDLCGLNIHIAFKMSQVKTTEMLFFGTFLMEQLKSSQRIESSSGPLLPTPLENRELRSEQNRTFMGLNPSLILP